MQAQLARATLQDHPRRLHRERRHRIWLGARRVEGTGSGETRDANLPLDLRVIRLEISVGDRPVSEAGAWNGAEHAALDEIDLVKAPEIPRIVQAPTTDRAAVPEGRLERLECRFLRRVIAKRLRIPDGIVGDTAEVPILELIVPDLRRQDPRPLLQHYHRESCP